MLLEETNKRQKILKELVIDLSKNIFDEEEDITKINKALTILYTLYFLDNGQSSGFRHNYSEFFPALLDISRERELDTLSHNLETLRTYVEKDYRENTRSSRHYNGLHKNLNKLCDHLNLEIARIDYYSKNENVLAKTAVEVARLDKQTKNAILELEKATDRLKSVQTDMIAVLSIFSAVVMAFFGGINYLSSAIAGLEHSSIFKVVIIIVIAGSVLFNCIFLLMFMVSRIIDRNILVRCVHDTGKCPCGQKCPTIKRFLHRLPYVFWPNLIFVITAVSTCFIWLATR